MRKIRALISSEEIGNIKARARCRGILLRVLSVSVVVFAVFLCGALPRGKSEIGVEDSQGFSVNLNMKINEWKCPHEGGAFLGKSNNLVINKSNAKTLCKFLHKKKKQFDAAIKQWHVMYKKTYAKISYFNIFKLIKYYFTSPPVFYVDVNVVYWHPLDTNRSSGFPQPWINANFAYTLPKSEELSFGCFDKMVEEYVHKKGRGGVDDIKAVTIALAPAATPDFSHETSYTLNFLSSILSSSPSSSSSSSSSSSPEITESVFAWIEELTSPVSLHMSLKHFWNYGGVCHVYDGRFLAENRVRSFLLGSRSVCDWAKKLKMEGFAHLLVGEYGRSVAVNVRSADFFQSQMPIFCGSVTETYGKKRKYPRDVCFFVDNNPANQKYHKNANTINSAENWIQAGGMLVDTLMKNNDGNPSHKTRGQDEEEEGQKKKKEEEENEEEGDKKKKKKEEEGGQEEEENKQKKEEDEEEEEEEEEK